ncbi:BTAD domain-containing putative transcriptional regulator [Pseudonocardia sp. C8]|uniref:BTAD domain-containing putative transcriptional regulator n=1 Tax=Pseudonocardia sp. C8 TaxID=2762759 RepID=UPI001C92EBBB
MTGLAGAPQVRVDVLGPLRLTVGADVVDVPGPKRRALLALLAMEEGRAVTTARLLDALWPDDLDSARAALHSHVSRLRRHLGPAAGRLAGRPGAYLLDPGDGDGTDVARARSLLASSSGSPPDVARRLAAEARSLWRGRPLAEFPDVAPLAALVPALDRLRRSVDETYAAAALDAGAPADAVDVAAALVATDPLSERAVLILMRALHATGRAPDALRVAYEHRRRIIAESGLDPTPALARLEREIAGDVRPDRGLPRPAGPLRGRDSELAALRRLLARERLVTVLGPGGVGKTRLATAITATTEPVTVLLLAPVTTTAAVPHALADALDLRITQGDVLSACAALLAAGPHLLVIDNCEHLLPAVRDVVAALIDRCPRLTVLATSREPLGLTVEQRLRIAPLGLVGGHRADDLSRSPAVAVFLDRARRVRPGFVPGPAELGLVAEIVRRLDGIPLAIELAAGRLTSLGLSEIHSHLDRALDLLGDAHDTTLRRTIEWSYDLLDGPERRLFRHLGAFPDGLDLATAESIATRVGVPGDTVRTLAHLVDASMVEAVPGSPTRYRLLDTMRAFARDRLAAHDEEEASTEEFLRWALDLAAWADRTIDTEDEPGVDAVLRRETANLRAAWELLRGRCRLDEAVRLVIGLDAAAGWRDLTEIWSWGLELTDDPALDTHPDATSIRGIAAGAAWARGELERAERLARAGLRSSGDGRWRCEAALALAALSRGELEDAVAHGTEAGRLAPRPDQSLGVAALAAAYRGDLDAARELNGRLAGVAASPTLRGFHHYVAGEIDASAGDTDRAEAHYEQAINLARVSGATFVDGIASVGLLTVRAATGRVADALDGYRDLVDYWERTGGWVQQWTTLRNLARLLRTLGDAGTALLLDTAADHAPDAPPVGDDQDPAVGDLPADSVSDVRAIAAVTGRAQVLAVARQAIADHRAAITRRAAR